MVNLASYAPLFAHVDGWQWTPDLIWVNNLQSFGTPNYYVQKLYSVYKGTNVVTALIDGKAVTGQDSLYVSAVTDSSANELIIKVVNASKTIQTKTIVLQGVKKISANALLTVLQVNNLNDVNSFTKPTHVAPVESAISLNGKELIFAAVPYSLSVIRIKL